MEKGMFLSDNVVVALSTSVQRYAVEFFLRFVTTGVSQNYVATI